MTLITMPSSPAFTKSEWGIRRAVAQSQSPFTGASQVHVYDLAQWYAVLTLPPMKRSQAVEWQAFFISCVGIANTFLFGDPDAKVPNGTAVSATVNSAFPLRAPSISINPGAGKTFNKGSYIQLGSGTSSKLYMITDDNTGSGYCYIQPPLKAAITTSTAVTITNPKGVFRMESNEMSWSTNEVSNYGMTFSVVEAL